MTLVPAQAVDVNVPRFNQAFVATSTGVAFIVDAPWLVAAVAAILIVSRLGGPRLSPLTQLYVRMVRPRLQPNGPTEFEAAEPPRFAQLLGGMFLTAATATFILGFDTLGWAITLAVTTLAALAASTRICIGCIVYKKVAG